MKKIKSLQQLFIVLLGVLMIAPGCTLYSHKGTTQSSTVFLEKSDYILSQPKTAKGETKIIFGLSIGENDKAADITTYTTYGTGGLSVSSGCCLAGIADPSLMAKSLALYNLMEKNPGYDAIMSPNYKIVTEKPCGIPIISTTTVTVTARLIKYK